MSLGAEKPPACGIMETSSTYSQVVFVAVPPSYPTKVQVKCLYTLTPTFVPSCKDWVGIFKVGWNTPQDYYTFVWATSSSDHLSEETVEKQVLFHDYYLPKEDGDFYQFCYVDSLGKVRGASTPFCFMSPEESSIDFIPSMENDLLVVSTQEQVEKVEKEKKKLQDKLEKKTEEFDILRTELDERLLEIRRLRDRKEELVNKISKLEEQSKLSMNQAEQTNTARNVELDDLKKENMELNRCLSLLKEEYDQTVGQTNHLTQERKEMKTKLQVREGKIALLNNRIESLEQEKQQSQEAQIRLQDQVQLLQVDLQSSQKANVKMSGELRDLRSQLEAMKGLQNENLLLYTRLSDLEQLDKDREARAQSQMLSKELEESNIRLQQEKQRVEESRKRTISLQREVQDLKMHMENRALSFVDTAQKNNKLEDQLIETRKLVEDLGSKLDIVEKEKEDLCRENKKLVADTKRLQEELSSLHLSSPPASITMQNPNPYHTSSLPPASQASNISCYANPYENSEDSATTEAERQCRYCKEVFPGINLMELEQHEQSHKMCPFCTYNCDDMNQVEFEEHVYSHED